jgi:hypothetical protein
VAISKEELVKSRDLNQVDDDMTDAHIFFNEIKEKVDQNNKISDAELEHFCYFINIADAKEFEGKKISDYPICKDYWFRRNILNYWYDLHGLSEYTGFAGRKISKEKALIDCSHLDQISIEWNEVIDKENHKDQLLQVVSKETRDEIKTFNKSPEFNTNGFLNKNENYKFRLKRLLLRSKYIYMKIGEIVELNDGNGVWYTMLNGKKIVINNYSLIHIFNRHFHMSEKQADKEKDLHDDTFLPQTIAEDLISIIDEINNSGFYINDDISKINIEWKGKLYTIYTKDLIFQVANKADEEISRVQTFYPVGDESEREKIINDYNLKVISDNLKVFVK